MKRQKKNKRSRVGRATAATIFAKLLKNTSESQSPSITEVNRAALAKTAKNETERIRAVSSRVSGDSIAARRALVELERVGIDRGKLFDFLDRIAATQWHRGRGFVGPPGISAETIKGLPERLRHMAQTVAAIEKYNARSVPGGWRELSCLLQACATGLGERLSAARGRHVDPSTELKVEMVQYVLENSRDRLQHYRELAILLNAFFKVEWLDQLECLGIDASQKLTPLATSESLRKLWIRNPGIRRPSEMGSTREVGPQKTPLVLPC